MSLSAAAKQHAGPRRGQPLLIPQRALVASMPFTDALGAEEVAAAIARGLRAGGCADPDVLALGDDPDRALATPGAGFEAPGVGLKSPGATLELADFEQRLRLARAVIVAAARLERAHLRATLEFEILTHARQAGVPAYAICRDVRLDAFDARLFDLQLVVEARTARAITAAARRLATVI